MHKCRQSRLGVFPRHLGGFVLTELLAAFLCASAWAAPLATVAEDVCASSAAPCVVTQEFEVTAGATLDFGLRTLRMEGGGALLFPTPAAVVKCGRLELARNGTGVRLGHSSPGQSVRVLVRRACSLVPTLACLVDVDCNSVGAGTCSVGDGSAVLGAALQSDGTGPGAFVLRAAGDVAVLATMRSTSSRSEIDGGSIEIESTQANLIVEATLDVRGGGGSAGGDLSLTAAGDVIVRSVLDARGGDYDGGVISIFAGRDLRIENDLLADSTSGEGAGGELELSAGRDVILIGGGPANRLLLGTDGHQSAENYGGDGGAQVIEAGRDLTVSRYVRLSASAAPPDGFGDTVSLLAERNLDFGGELVARGRGNFGGAAFVDLTAGGWLRTAADASFDLTGAAAGGDLYLDSDGRMESAAPVDVSSSPDGVAGRIVAEARGDAFLSGSWRTAGGQWASSFGDLTVSACDVMVDATLVNAATSGRISLVAREKLSILAGGALLATGEGGSNALRYRAASDAPEILGTVLPLGTPIADPQLLRCPRCGDGQVDPGESCDDANLQTGDGCSSVCQDEGCEASTVGYPLLALCDDGSDCTAGHCDRDSHRCVQTPVPAECSVEDFCDASGTCVDGSCQSRTEPELVVSSFKVKLGEESATDRGLWNLEFPTSLVHQSPNQSGVRLRLSGSDGEPLWEARLPPGGWTGGEGSWRFKPARGEALGAILRGSLKAREGRPFVKAKFRIRAATFERPSEAEALRFALVLGESPAEAPCASSGPLLCHRASGKIRCASPPAD